MTKKASDPYNDTIGVLVRLRTAERALEAALDILNHYSGGTLKTDVAAILRNTQDILGKVEHLRYSDPT